MRKLNIANLKKSIGYKKACIINKYNFYFDDFDIRSVEDSSWVLSFGKDNAFVKQKKKQGSCLGFLGKKAIISRADFRMTGISSWSFQLSSKVVLSRVTNC